MDRSLLSRERLMAEAADWFAAFGGGVHDAAENADFAAWLLRSPAHIAAFLDIACGWGAIGAAVGNTSCDAELSVDSLVRAAVASSDNSNVCVLASFAQTSGAHRPVAARRCHKR